AKCIDASIGENSAGCAGRAVSTGGGAAATGGGAGAGAGGVTAGGGGAGVGGAAGAGAGGAGAAATVTDGRFAHPLTTLRRAAARRKTTGRRHRIMRPPSITFSSTSRAPAATGPWRARER